MDNYLFNCYLARKLTDKWKISGKLPYYHGNDGTADGSTFNSVAYMQKRNIYAFFYTHTAYSIYDYSGPIIKTETVLAEVWDSLDETEKTRIMSEILGSHD